MVIICVTPDGLNMKPQMLASAGFGKPKRRVFPDPEIADSSRDLNLRSLLAAGRIKYEFKSGWNDESTDSLKLVSINSFYVFFCDRLTDKVTTTTKAFKWQSNLTSEYSWGFLVWLIYVCQDIFLSSSLWYLKFLTRGWKLLPRR